MTRWLHAAVGLLLSLLVVIRMIRFPNLAMQLPHLALGALLVSRRLPLIVSSLVLAWVAMYAIWPRPSNSISAKALTIPSDSWSFVVAWKACSAGSALAALLGTRTNDYFAPLSMLSRTLYRLLAIQDWHVRPHCCTGSHYQRTSAKSSLRSKF